MSDSNDWQVVNNYLDKFSQITKDFLSDLDTRKVAILNSHLAELLVPEKGLGFWPSVEHLEQQIIPQLSASRGPRYWGFVTGGATPVATFADWLVTSFDQNLSKDGDSVACQVERQTLRWLCELFDLPEAFQGIVTTGATASNFLGALCARQYAGRVQAIDVAKNGVYNLSVEVFATTPHASMLKSMGMAGLGQQHLTMVKPLNNSEAMDTSDLESKLKISQAKAKIIIASAGTVTATDFDDLIEICRLRDEHAAWLHVDAAFGLFERLDNSKKLLSKGIEQADSITVDCHKWLNVPYESGVFLTRDLSTLFDSCDVPAPYLINQTNIPDFMSLGVENSRRFRALPIWMTLLAYGKAGIAQWVNRNIQLAGKFADKIKRSTEYELMLECQLNVVLFRPDCSGLSQYQADLKTKRYLELINRDGRVFLSPGEWQGQQIIRAALSNWQTQEVDVAIAFQCLMDIAKRECE